MAGKGYENYKVVVPLGDDDSLLVSSFHMSRMRNQSTSLPVDADLRVVGLAHAVHIGRGLGCPDSVQLQFYRDVVENGERKLLDGPTAEATSPGKPLAMNYVRSFSIKQVAGDAGSANGAAEGEFYLLSYDQDGVVITSPRLASVYLPRAALEMPGSEPSTAAQGWKRPAPPKPPQDKTHGAKRPFIGPRPTIR